MIVCAHVPNTSAAVAILPKSLASGGWLLSLLCAIGSISGCASNPPVGTRLDRNGIEALNAAAMDVPYRLTPGDRIAIKFVYGKELDDEVTIRPDGKI